MSRPTLDPWSPRGLMLMTGLCGMALIPAVLAQEQRMMVFESDDGAGPQLVTMTGPDLGELRKPDYVRRDLPVFHEKLRLDEVQQLVVGTLLDTYLDAFRALLEDSMPEGTPFGMGMVLSDHGPDHDHGHGPGMGMEDGELGELIEQAIAEARAGNGQFGEVDVELNADAGGAMAIAITAGAGDTTVDAGDMPEMEGADISVWAGTSTMADGSESFEPGVMIAVATPGDIEISEELQQKLAEKAQELAERLEQRIAELEAEGLTPHEAAGEMLPDMSIEAHEQRIEEIKAAAEKIAKGKEALGEAFLTEVRAQLSAAQLGHWPEFERAMTRFKTLPKGRLDGERTDLLLVYDDVDAGEATQEKLGETLVSYEIDLDRALRERNEFIGEANRKLDEYIQAGEFDKALRLVDSATRLRVGVRTVNDQYSEKIAEQLPVEQAEQFRESVRKRSYPRVYRRTYAQKSFKKIRALDDLDPDILAGLDEIEQAYLAELDALNDRILETIRREQPKESREMVERIQAMMTGEGEESGMRFGFHPGNTPVGQALSKRKDLDERYVKQVHALLTPEQVAELPPLPSQVRRQPLIIQRSPPGPSGD